MSKELLLFSGRAYKCVKPGDQRWAGRQQGFIHGARAFVAAYSISDVRRVITEYTGTPASTSEIENYWRKNAWGDLMDYIVPERGLWVRFQINELPVKLY